MHSHSSPWFYEPQTLYMHFEGYKNTFALHPEHENTDKLLIDSTPKVLKIDLNGKFQNVLFLWK